MKTAITISLVPQARQGPFVFHGDLPGSIAKAAALGFDAVEIFPPAADAILRSELRRMLLDHNLQLAAIGTGAGWVVQKLTLTDPDSSARAKAIDFVKGIIDLAGEFSAPAIIGSMQGRHANGETTGNPDADRKQTIDLLTDSISRLAAHAKTNHNTPLLYEPLNRYETNLFNRQINAADWLRLSKIENVRILADLFHMNIEEQDVVASLGQLGSLLGHVHFVDSNRQAPGWGHTDFAPIMAALRRINYTGYLSAECFPIPDTNVAAQQTITRYKELLESRFGVSQDDNLRDSSN